MNAEDLDEICLATEEAEQCMENWPTYGKGPPPCDRAMTGPLVMFMEAKEGGEAKVEQSRSGD